MRNDNITNYAYVGNGNGTTPPELYLAFHADNLADPALIQPGQTAKLQNEQVRALRCIVGLGWPWPAVRCMALCKSTLCGCNEDEAWCRDDAW